MFTIIILFVMNTLHFIILAVFDNVYMLFFSYYFVFGMIVPLADVTLFKKLPVRQLFSYIRIVPVPKKQGILAGFISGIIIFGIIYLFFLFSKQYALDEQAIKGSIEEWGVTKDYIVFSILIMVIFNGAVEELFWRGYIHRRLESMKSRFLAIFINVFFFTAGHTYVIWSFTGDIFLFSIFMAGIAVGSITWSILREHYKNTLPAAISHMLATLGYISVFCFFVL